MDNRWTNGESFKKTQRDERMNSQELREYVRKLNEQERHQHEIRRQQALRRIQELRKKIREKDHSPS